MLRNDMTNLFYINDQNYEAIQRNDEDYTT